MSGMKLEIRDVTKTFSGSYDSITALQSVTLSIGSDEIVSLIGPSGCGKSTLLDIIAGLTEPDIGEIIFDDEVITGNKGIAAYMPQKDVLFPWRTVLDNVVVGLEVQGLDKREARREGMNLLPVFGLENFMNSHPLELSGGMRQRASLLRTYLCKKDLMLLDEPFGKLDAITRLQLQMWLLDIWQQLKHAILFVTHDVDEAILLSDRIYVMSSRPGKIVAEIKVDFPRPRGSGIVSDLRFIALREEILNLLGKYECIK